MFIKLSLLWFYLRLDRHGYMKWAVYALSFVVLGLSISSVLILIFSCFPPSKFWDITGTVSGHCMSASSQQTFYEANGVLNIVTDILIYLTPIPMLWKVQIPLVRLEIYPSFREKPLTHCAAQEDCSYGSLWTWKSRYCR